MRVRTQKPPPPPQLYSLPVLLPDQQLDLSTCRTILVEFARYLQFARGQTYMQHTHLDSLVVSHVHQGWVLMAAGYWLCCMVTNMWVSWAGTCQQQQTQEDTNSGAAPDEGECPAARPLPSVQNGSRY
jgi:hypothetical protein